MISDQLLLDIGFEPVPLLLQLFCKLEGGQLVAIIAKTVDVILLVVFSAVTDSVVSKISTPIKLGTIVHGSSYMRYFDQNLHQAEDCSTCVDGDDNLISEFSMPLSHRRRDLLASLNTIETKSFASLNFTIGWLGITSSTFCASCLSRRQKMEPSTAVRLYLYKDAELRDTKALASTVSFPRPDDNDPYGQAVTVFSDAGFSAMNGQL